jgi:hemerythrin-like metal-binding protein
LINDILDLSTVESGKVYLSKETVALKEVFDECLANSHEYSNRLGKNISFKTSCDFAELPLIHADRTRLKQVLFNLLSNAAKYNHEDGSVVLGCLLTSDGMIRINVTDTGLGILENRQDSIFEPFNRMGAETTDIEGTGLGLTITKQLVEMMDGRIGFESETGKGSTFWIELPLTINEEVTIWTDTLRIGVDAIDKDHQVLFSLLNKVMNRSVDNADLNQVINELVDYTHYHFRREEAIMEVCGYLDFEKHRGMHQLLSAQVTELVSKWRKNHDPEVLDHIRKFLQDWLLGHITGVRLKSEQIQLIADFDIV